MEKGHVTNGPLTRVYRTLKECCGTTGWPLAKQIDSNCIKTDLHPTRLILKCSGKTSFIGYMTHCFKHSSDVRRLVGSYGDFLKEISEQDMTHAEEEDLLRVQFGANVLGSWNDK